MRILKNRFRTRHKFLEAYKDDLPYGGLFCPTTKPLEENEPVVVEIFFPGLPNKMLLRGTVAWWRSSLPRLRVRAGAMVAFIEEENEKKSFILEIATGKREGVIKRKHPRIPVELPVKWRPVDSSVQRESTLSEISIGGGLLKTEEKLPADTELVLELTTPGGTYPISIAGKVAYSSVEGCGIKFIYRDGGGSQRLREMVRRIIQGKQS